MLQTGLNLSTSSSGISKIANGKEPNSNKMSFHFGTSEEFPMLLIHKPFEFIQVIGFGFAAECTTRRVRETA